MHPISIITGRIVALPAHDIDTDQIIPARYLKVTDKSGLAEGLFYAWRFDAEGKPNPDFVLNRPEAQGATILVAGRNFGCGSSREHAPWALQGYGFKAVISPSFADIFRNNALKNGLLTVQTDEETWQQLVSLFEEDPTTEVIIDLATQTVTLPDGRQARFPIDPFTKHCLLQGIDQMGFLLNEEDAISAYESAHPPRVVTTARS
ncbi:3-isopropylmalate dehydratase small subunit [Roseiflexus castenholzii]|jgi:3-isopropylmalate/(R)-2-methylmalate dehydratase small subunit|uniref:3-isopropylmalate dehydratase small subunit n=1 Tax=Roseiflexus castenholzii (strain DSM 13941 / HLO8) TaxID=383372 RepID=LEUD_ROSCS|nr:3-isopropylmalate dehydratase small subunit [Roseiflexus castenholzii]A7NJH1.1 RecName: Full=3-isopropylmalate dehydratase small subunit; AltName: Full=Alpha-IPM isomerase; Short=IPMI; AltName: Full=Isopropylmalate isomerase [Roseiflexus castenholzii DSM 13941]ABU57641.1 3-isopropylmalate dehydratase, small subunit [Roseiflexus castenholzii DSM 13941]